MLVRQFLRLLKVLSQGKLSQGQRRPRPGRPLRVETLEDRLMPATTVFAPIDGVGNNLANPNRGAAGTDLIRQSPVAFADGVRSPSLPNAPSARVVSDILNSQADPNNPAQDLATASSKNLSAFGYSFGQFIDHDMDLTPSDPTHTTTIPADPNDPSKLGDQTFARSVIDSKTGTSASNPAQQVNAVTSFLDLSQVYGSNQVVADALRSHSGGLLKTSPGNLLPYDSLTYFTQDQIDALNMANDANAVSQDRLFAAGDVRANENAELTALQTLFMRNHNRIAQQLQNQHPGWTDEQLYQEARRLNIAQYQQIIYTQYLPDLLGKNALPKYTGYDPNTDPSIATEFSTVGFRFGHSTLSSDVERVGNNGQEVAGGALGLATDFFDPNAISAKAGVDPLTGLATTNIGPLLKGAASNVSQKDDLLAVSDIRNVLFGNGGLTNNGQDLIARDIQRARDHGIGTYNQVRQAYGLPALTDFTQISSDPAVQAKLQQAYQTVDNIDPFEGGLAEDHARGSDMGPLFTAILTDQFTRLRDGDRFFYAHQDFNSAERKIIQQGNTLAEVIQNNTAIRNLQNDVFIFQVAIGGTVYGDKNGNSRKGRRDTAVAGQTVQIVDADSGDVLATTTTDAQGRYRFTQADGMQTGRYLVQAVLPDGSTRQSRTVSITRGDQFVTNVNLGLPPAPGHTPWNAWDNG